MVGKLSSKIDKPWQIKKTSDIMLLICYVLKTVDQKIMTDIIIKSIEQEEIAEYFDIIDALSELRKIECVTFSEENKVEYVTLTQLGRETSTELEKTVSAFVRSRAAKAAMKALYRLKVERETNVIIQKEEETCFVTCEVLDGDKILLSQTVRCGDIYQAERIKEQFIATPSLIYRGTLALLCGDVDSIGGFSAIADGLTEKE